MTTIVFPGQGSQFVEMSKDFYENFDESKRVFELISDVTKIDIKNIIFNNPSNFLNQTQYTQLSIFCSSISIFEALKNNTNFEKLNIKYMLGHSLGEYSALTAAGILSIESCALLLKSRGELMQNAYEPNKSGMAAILGLNSKTVEEIISKNNLKIEIANDNSPIQVVISGINRDIIESEVIFKKENAKRFIVLNVSAAFHSILMIEAEKQMKKIIENTLFYNSSISIISNFSGKISNNLDTIILNLSKQMSNRVRWVESIKELEETGENKIIEIGPSKVLTGLIKRISDKFIINNIETISDIKNEL